MRALWWTVGSRFKSRERLEAENLALWHQVTVLRRSAPERLRLRGSDRFLFVWLYRLWPSVLDSVVIIRPDRSFRSWRPERIDWSKLSSALSPSVSLRRQCLCVDQDVDQILDVECC